ncbi:MAG: hypothetical protein ACR2M0_05420 [Chloroflexia bacterium]
MSRHPRSLIFWGSLLAAGWAVFPLLLFTHTLSLEPSFLPQTLPNLYEPVARLLPHNWVAAKLSAGPARTATILLYVGLVSGLWAAYVASVRAAGRADRSRWVGHPLAGVLLGLGVFGGIALFWPALFSSDLYAYAVQGKMQIAGLNPLVQPPRLLATDPLVAPSPWRDTPPPMARCGCW